MADIEEIRDEVSVLEVLAHYGGSTGSRGWTSTGGWQAYDCPFCGDTNGSGSVNPSAGRYLCHQCGEPRDGKSGDVIDIVASQEQLSTREAIEWITSTFLR